MSNGPDDRIKKTNAEQSKPEIKKAVEIKVPGREVHIMQPDETNPGDKGTCSCHSVCTCVPVTECSCHVVCTCDSVCATNTCTCHPHSGGGTCGCQPVCTCHGHSCCVGVYWYPN